MPLGAIREVGEFEVDVQLHSDVTTTVGLVIVAESESCRAIRRGGTCASALHPFRSLRPPAHAPSGANARFPL